MKSRECIFSVSQSTLRRVLTKMTACVMVRVSYRSHSVSSFHSCESRQESVVRLRAQEMEREKTYLFLDLDVKLFDSLQSQLLLLDEDANRVPHEPLGHLQHV